MAISLTQVRYKMVYIVSYARFLVIDHGGRIKEYGFVLHCNNYCIISCSVLLLTESRDAKPRIVRVLPFIVVLPLGVAV